MFNNPFGGEVPQEAREQPTPQPDQFDESDAIYSPSETSALGIQIIEKIRDQKSTAISIGMPLIDQYFAPVRVGQVAGIVGQTSHAKSTLLHYIEHQAVHILAKQKRENAAVIHVSLEEVVEEQAFMEFAKLGKEEADKLANGDVQDWDALLKVSYQVEKIPIYRIGDSIGRSANIPRLYLSNVFKAIDRIRKVFKIEIAMIGVDYLQALPPDPSVRGYDYDTQRRLQVRMDAYRLREGANRFACPVWVNCQAKQNLGNSEQQPRIPSLRIPSMYDINESADVAQRFDRLLGVWLPARTYDEGTKIKWGDQTLAVTPSMFFIKINKQRGMLRAGRVYLCEIDFKTGTIIPKAFKD